jgi:hypothetical protein
MSASNARRRRSEPDEDSPHGGGLAEFIRGAAQVDGTAPTFELASCLRGRSARLLAKRTVWRAYGPSAPNGGYARERNRPAVDCFQRRSLCPTRAG